MRWPAAVAASFLALSLVACDLWKRALPFPTPAQSDLVVLVRPGLLTYGENGSGTATGLEHDLAEAFAQELGVGVRYLPAAASELEARLDRGEAHFAAAWHTPDDAAVPVPPFMASRDVVAQSDASLPIDDASDLAGRTIHVLAGSRQAAALRALQEKVSGLQVVEVAGKDVVELLEAVDAGKAELAAVDSAELAIAQQFVPGVQATLELGEERPIAWIFGGRHNPELLARASAFIARARTDGTLERLKERYFGHVRRLKPADITRFLELRQTLLPRLRKHFVAAQGQSGIDWRLLAAVAYQESQWDASATSPTGVRGIMMLTEETADRLGVSNRLDPRESIMAGARYLGFLKDSLPAGTPEPDRTWMALAAYNLGPGHFNAGRTLARQQKANPDAWYDMRRILPLLAQPKYYERLKSGRGRGGEAVILVENIRSYYDILSRQEPAWVPELPETAPNGRGLRLKAAPARTLSASAR